MCSCAREKEREGVTAPRCGGKKDLTPLGSTEEWSSFLDATHNRKWQKAATCDKNLEVFQQETFCSIIIM